MPYNEIAAHLEGYGLIIVESDGKDKYQYRVCHRLFGCIANIKQESNSIKFFYHVDNTEYEFFSFNEFVSELIDNEERIPFKDFLDKISNSVNVSIEKSNDSVKSLVSLIQYLILNKGLSMHISRMSLDKDMLLQFENNYNNTKSFVIHSDKVVDGHGAIVRDELDIYMYLGIK